MAAKMMLYSLEVEAAEVEVIGKVDCLAGERYVDLRKRLEEFKVVEWPFDFWDAEGRFRIKARLEGMITVDLIMHVIQRSFVEDEVVVSNFGDIILEFPKVPEFVSPLDGVADGPFLADPASTSKVSGLSADAAHMTSDVIPKLVSKKFEKGAARLCHEFKLFSLEDHAWYLKTWDEGGVGIVKLYCVEYSKDIGSGVWDHNTTTVTNLFLNFKKIHINSIRHFKSYCRRKGEVFENHPASVVP
jgi:hypothetical protein